MLNLLACQRLCHLPGLRWLFGVVPLFLLDQISKWYILKNFTGKEALAVLPGLQLIRAHNYGIAFSLFNQQNVMGKVVLLIFIMAICLFIARWLLITPLTDKWSGIALMMILAGALGNLADRLWHGYVIDFIDFYLGSWHWYTFNVADTFITLGAMMLVKTIFTAEDK